MGLFSLLHKNTLFYKRVAVLAQIVTDNFGLIFRIIFKIKIIHDLNLIFLERLIY